jgi:hypothetical protein
MPQATLAPFLRIYLVDLSTQHAYYMLLSSIMIIG